MQKWWMRRVSIAFECHKIVINGPEVKSQLLGDDNKIIGFC